MEKNKRQNPVHKTTQRSITYPAPRLRGGYTPSFINVRLFLPNCLCLGNNSPHAAANFFLLKKNNIYQHKLNPNPFLVTEKWKESVFLVT